MQTELPDCYLPMNAVWSLLPKHVERSFESFCTNHETKSLNAEIEDCVALLWIWDRFDFERRMKSTPIRNRTLQPWADKPGPAASSFRERAIASRDHRLVGLTAKRRQGEADRQRLVKKQYAILCCAGLVGGWIFSPLGWFSVILFLISLGYMAWSSPHRKLSATVCLFFLLFLLGGISRDLLDDVQPTAVCADGSYSYSAHRSGTCSWHGGVSGWNPTIRHWWQTLLGV